MTVQNDKPGNEHFAFPPRSAGILGTLRVPIGLGILRLGTEGRPSQDDAVAVIHCALDRGIRVLDTADVYALDQKDVHYGERLVRLALDSWNGPKLEVKVLTKAGLMRPKGRWMPNGRPEHLRKAVDGSLIALGVERLFLLQLHARDSRVPLEETLAALAELRREGKIEHLGLCNVTPGEIRQAIRHFPVAVVQNELSVLQRKSAADGTLTFTRDQGIPFLAYRPLGGYAKVERLAKSAILVPLAERHNATPHEVALAALLEAAPNVVPLIGATRKESIASSVKALRLALDVSDRTALEMKYSFAPSAAGIAAVSPPPSPAQVGVLQPNQGPGDTPEVVLLMGIQGAGKSELVAGYIDSGYVQLNRDLLGGKLEDLVPRLVQLLSSGQKRVVMDNTYPSRQSRASAIAAANAHGVPVRCRHLNTPLAEARVNIVMRMIARYGRPLSPEEMKTFAKTDPNLPPPAAVARWLGSFEPPALDEGFAVVDTIPFVRRHDPSHTEKGLLLDVDGTLRKTRSGELYPRDADDVEILPGRRNTLLRWVEAGYGLFLVSNQSGIASGKLTRAAAEAALQRTVELLQLPVLEIAFCPHSAFPVVCYCRKPMPGLGVHLIHRYRLSRQHLIMVGDMDSDEEFAASLGARYYDAQKFFSLNGPGPD